MSLHAATPSMCNKIQGVVGWDDLNHGQAETSIEGGSNTIKLRVTYKVAILTTELMISLQFD